MSQFDIISPNSYSQDGSIDELEEGENTCSHRLRNTLHHRLKFINLKWTPNELKGVNQPKPCLNSTWLGFIVHDSSTADREPWPVWRSWAVESRCCVRLQKCFQESKFSDHLEYCGDYSHYRNCHDLSCSQHFRSNLTPGIPGYHKQRDWQICLYLQSTTRQQLQNNQRRVIHIRLRWSELE
jgi:hypothetical protein